MDGGTFNFYNGQIIGNSSRYSGTGIYLFGSSYMPARLYMYGGSLVDDITQNYGSTVVQPTNPTKLGHTFVGWYSDEALTTSYIFETMPAEDITLYAKWNINEYSISFDSNQGSAVQDITQNYGSTVIQPTNPTKLGHTFMGWFSDEALTTSYIFETMPAEDITLYAKWNINQYSINFNSNQGSDVQDITQNYGSTVIQPTNPSKLGHTFMGWYSDEALTTSYTFSTMPAEDITLYAKWNINQYSISFNTIGGTEISPIIEAYGTQIIAPNAPEKAGFTFNGWKQIIPITMPAQDMIIEACWMKITNAVDSSMNLETSGLIDALDLTSYQNKNIEVVIEYVLNQKDDVNPSVIDLIQIQITKKQNYSVMDISIIIKVDGQSDVIINTLTEKIMITLNLSESDQGYKNYQIMRIHDGQIEILESVYDKDNQTISFETDSFSNYVLVYEVPSSNAIWWLMLLLIIPIGYIVYRYREQLRQIVSRKNH